MKRLTTILSLPENDPHGFQAAIAKLAAEDKAKEEAEERKFQAEMAAAKLRDKERASSDGQKPAPAATDAGATVAVNAGAPVAAAAAAPVLGLPAPTDLRDAKREHETVHSGPPTAGASAAASASSHVASSDDGKALAADNKESKALAEDDVPFIRQSTCSHEFLLQPLVQEMLKTKFVSAHAR